MATAALMDGAEFASDSERRSVTTTASSNDEPKKLQNRAMLRFTADLLRRLEPSADEACYLKAPISAPYEPFIMGGSTTLETAAHFGTGVRQDVFANIARTRLEMWLGDLYLMPTSDIVLVDDGGTLEAIAQEIRSYANLRENWDGHGAARISSSAMEHILEFLRANRCLAAKAEPFPDPNGNVGLEARVGTKVLYLSFAPSGEIAYLARDGHAIDRGRGADSAKIRNVLQAIF